MSYNTSISLNDSVVTPSLIKTVIPPFLLLTGGFVSLILFISTIVYYITTNDCDIVFWILLILAILTAIISSMGSFVNNFIIMNKFLTAVDRQCNLSPLGKELLNEPLLNPWIGGTMSILAFILFMGAVIYFLIVEECDGIFWGLLIIAFFLNNIGSFRDYINTKFAIRISNTELDNCNNSSKICSSLSRRDLLQLVGGANSKELTDKSINIRSSVKTSLVPDILPKTSKIPNISPKTTKITNNMVPTSPCQKSKNKSPDYSLSSKILHMN